MKSNGTDYREVTYVLTKNGNLYVVLFMTPELRASERNLKLIDEAWQSLKFE